MICFMTFDMFLWKPVSANEYKNKKRLLWLFNLTILTFFPSELWDINSQLPEKNQNCEIKGRNYLFYFFHMFSSWNLLCVELIHTSSQTFRCKFQNVILELITEAWAIDMQANAVINAVFRERERERCMWIPAPVCLLAVFSSSAY